MQGESPSVDFTDRAERLAAEVERLRRANAMPSDVEEQQDLLALLAWELGRFCAAGAHLLRGEYWGPTHSFVRLISERAEYILAVHESAPLARELWARAMSLDNDEITRVPQIRSGEARTHIRRLTERLTSEEASLTTLKLLIERHDWESFVLHPGAVGAALGERAERDPSAASFVQGIVAFSIWYALASLRFVVSERASSPDLGESTDLLSSVRLDLQSKHFVPIADEQRASPQ